jgi:hypothetical protein
MPQPEAEVKCNINIRGISKRDGWAGGRKAEKGGLGRTGWMGRMVDPMAGYSGKPLWSKLGVRAGSVVHVKDAPPDYRDLLEPLPEGVTFVARMSSTTDLVHVFSANKAELATWLRRCRSTLRPTAVLWVSWPKKSAKMPTDITEDTIRELALPLGFVDVKVCAVSEVWSGLKLVVRQELR